MGDKTAYVAPTTITKKDAKEKKEKKTALKEQGMSGGQHNKDPDVVKMVARMQELKIKSGEISGDAKEDKKKAKGKGPKGDPEEIKKLTQEIETTSSSSRRSSATPRTTSPRMRTFSRCRSASRRWVTKCANTSPLRPAYATRGAATAVSGER